MSVQSEVSRPRTPRRPATYRLSPSVRRELPAIEARIQHLLVTLTPEQFQAASVQAARDLGI